MVNLMDHIIKKVLTDDDHFTICGNGSAKSSLKLEQCPGTCRNIVAELLLSDVGALSI